MTYIVELVMDVGDIKMSVAIFLVYMFGVIILMVNKGITDLEPTVIFQF